MVGLLLIVCYLCVGATSTVTYLANKALKEQGLYVELEKLHINPFIWKISLTSLTLSHKQSPFLFINELNVDVDFIALIQGEIVIEQLLLGSTNVTVELNGNEVSFAGWQPKHEETTKVQNDQADFSVLVESLDLQNVNVELIAEQTHRWHIAQLFIENFDISNEHIALNFDLKSQLNQRPLNLKGASQYVLSNTDTQNKNQLILPLLTATIQLADYKQWFPVEMDTLAGEVTLSAQIDLTQQESWLVNFNQLNLSVTALQLPVPIGKRPIDLALQTFELNTQKVTLTLDEAFQLTEANIIANVLLNELNWQENTTGAQVVQFESATIKDLTLDIAEQTKISLTALDINNGLFSQLKKLPSITLAEAFPEPVVQFNQFKINQLDYEVDALIIGSIIANVNDVTLYKSTEHAVENLYVIGSNERQNKSESANASLDINIGQISVIGEPNITFNDHTPTVPVEHKVTVKKLQLVNIRSTDNTLADLTFTAAMGKRSHIDINGKLSGLNVAQNSQFNMKISGLDLTHYSPYVSDAIHHNIKHGLLFADIDMQIHDEQVTGVVHTNIKAIELSELQSSTNAKQPTGASTIIPLDIALKQLTDDQGNIDVKIPLEGSVHDPNFGLNGFIAILTTKALKEAAKSYLIQTFLPYANIVSVAMMAGDTLFDIKVNPLAYHPNQIDLLDEQLAHAKALAKMLTEKQDAQLTVCALVVPSADGVTLPLSEVLFTQYQQQGAHRVDQFIDYLIENEGIAAQRLIPCETQVSTEKNANNNLNFTLK